MPWICHSRAPSPGNYPAVLFPGGVDLSGKFFSSVLQACTHNWHWSLLESSFQFFPYCSSIPLSFSLFHVPSQPIHICASPHQLSFYPAAFAGEEKINFWVKENSLIPNIVLLVVRKNSPDSIFVHPINFGTFTHKKDNKLGLQFRQ